MSIKPEHQHRLIYIVVLLAFGIVAAQELPPQLAEHMRHGEVLEMYLFSDDMPVSKAFAAYALAIKELEKHVPGAGAEELMISLDLSEGSASAMAKAIIESHTRIRENSKANASAMSCIGGNARVFDDKAFDVIQKILDAENQEEVDEYQKFAASLSREIRQRLDAVLEKHKRNSAYYRIDHKKAYSRTGQSVDAGFAQYCLGLDEQEPVKLPEPAVYQYHLCDTLHGTCNSAA